MNYQGDALWGACPDGGDIELRGGNVVRSGGLSGAAYISMFGGNHEDDGTPGSFKQWWGNDIEPNTLAHIRGRTGTLLAGLPMASGNLGRVIGAVNSDLAWMITAGVVTTIEVAAAIEAARRILITVTFNGDDVTEFRENWISGLTEPALTCAT